jgi:hypothetical protein
LRNWFWTAVAEFAMSRSDVNFERERDAEDADERAFHARRGDWWHDVACYADGLESWASLKAKRARRRRATAPLMPPIAAFEPTRIGNPIVFVLAILAAVFLVSMAMPFLLPKPGTHVAEAGK